MMAPSAVGVGTVLLTLLVWTRHHGDARPHLRGDRCSPPGENLQETLRLLRNVGSTFPESCHYIYNNVTLPSNISANHSQCPATLRLVHEALEGAGHIFNQQNPDFGVGGVLWDKKNFDDFQSLLYLLLKQGCVGSSRLLESYFVDVKALLHKQDNCGWYVLRRDLMKILRNSLRMTFHCYSWTTL